jgi:1-acyl-sn-glycerol-3-phosphate acyltransferase
MAVAMTNNKITVHGNTEAFKQNNLLIMANHYAGLDFGILTDLYYQHNRENILYTIAKSNLLGDSQDKSVISKMLYYVKDSYMASKYLIPYKRGDKEDGTVVKEKIAGYLEQNANIMVFPEGTTSKNGVPLQFKSGIFKLAVEKKISILPITLKYKKDIGSVIGEPLIFSKWFDNELDIYIHDTYVRTIIGNSFDEILQNEFKSEYLVLPMIDTKHILEIHEYHSRLREVANQLYFIKI